MGEGAMVRDRGEGGGLLDLSGVVYGVRVRGRLPAAFRSYLLPLAAGSAGSLDLGYRIVDELPEAEETWASEALGPGGTVRFALVRLPEGFGLTVAGEGRGLFRCTPRSIRIEWRAPGTGAPHYLFTYALPLWLETEGVPVLHASAVSAGGRAVAFVGRSGVGKSVLCAELLRLGCGFVADDGLALRRDEGRAARGGWLSFPGPPLLRLWPSGLESRLEIPAHTLPRVHESLDKRRLPLSGEGTGALPLAAVYVLRRDPEEGGEVGISAYGPREALVRLIEHSVAAAPAAALGLSGRRLDLLAELAETVPVRQLRFPSGADSAERILEAIGGDLDAATEES